jgi:hypothetical protein
VGVIDLHVHVQAKMLADVLSEIAIGLALRVNLPETDDPVAWDRARREVISAAMNRRRPSVVVVDAIDEARGEGEARRIAQHLLKPLVSSQKALVRTSR